MKYLRGNDVAKAVGYVSQEFGGRSAQPMHVCEPWPVGGIWGRKIIWDTKKVNTVRGGKKDQRHVTALICQREEEPGGDWEDANNESGGEPRDWGDLGANRKCTEKETVIAAM